MPQRPCMILQGSVAALGCTSRRPRRLEFVDQIHINQFARRPYRGNDSWL
jgi:hypothetical protein